MTNKKEVAAGEDKPSIKDLIAENEMLAGYIERMYKNTLKKGTEHINIHTLENRKKRMVDYWDNFYRNHILIIQGSEFKGY